MTPGHVVQPLTNSSDHLLMTIRTSLRDARSIRSLRMTHVVAIFAHYLLLTTYYLLLTSYYLLLTPYYLLLTTYYLPLACAALHEGLEALGLDTWLG